MLREGLRQNQQQSKAAMKKQSQKVTITTIAEKAGCSITTVSFVLNGRAREMGISERLEKEVRATVEELHYLPNEMARGLRTRKSNVIGVIFLHLINDWASHVVKGIRGVMRPNNYFPVITVNDYNEEVERREIESLVQRRVDAILCEPMLNADTYQFIQRNRVPLVFIGTTPSNMSNVSYVAWDTFSAAQCATRHLVQTGRKRIAFLNWDDPRETFTSRLDGFRETMRESGLEVRPDWVHSIQPFASPDSIIQRLFSTRPESRPDAVFAAVDLLAAQTMGAFDSMGIRLPEDCALLTLGSAPASAHPRIGLTSVEDPGEEMGEEAARIALQLIGSPDTPPVRKIITKNNLIIRKTA